MGDGSEAPLTFVKDAFRFTWDRLTNCLRVQEMFPAAYDQAQDARKIETIVYAIRSDKDSYFESAVDEDDSLDENLTGLASNKIRIKRVSCIAQENWEFDIAFWEKDTFQDSSDLDEDSWKGMVSFLAADGVQINPGTYTQYYYDSGPMDLPLEDLDGTYELHCSYVARDANKGAEEFVLLVQYEVCS